MTYLVRQVVMGAVIGVAVLVVAWVVVNRSESSAVDKDSYTAGYNAFGGAFMPTDDRSREQVEADCDSILRQRQLAAPEHGLVQKDWIQGCADAAQNKDSRFE
ncbi:hypothetical protein TU94_21525 [Streptomyces cyaneogriseus subsp. noncyanogenus]|uniref:Uncharacterized protein n=1 Tax=Streptomyces cyaneogriseus subsp. noncyanogenus TaxID=477245 RepID=A0A0C5GGX3_9ACTN|nr:hypothetical protein [Streptomyces cyaneogriseus]AJP03681.1 hypothetical protein TU94_21525 [Streptomyces cyaneogriseus subsp. noncyanogenus]